MAVMHPVTLLLLSTRTHTTDINTIHNTPVVETIFFCCTCITIFIAQLYNASVTVESFFYHLLLKKNKKFKCSYLGIEIRQDHSNSKIKNFIGLEKQKKQQPTEAINK